MSQEIPYHQPEDGGPAFPVNTANEGDARACYPSYGMSLRDYFAATAMQSIRADESFALRHDPDQVADRAYELADAMLKARNA